MELRGTQFSIRDAYPNSVGIPSTSEYTQPEAAEQTQLYDADGNQETIVEMRAGAKAVSIWMALAVLLGVVVVGGWLGVR